jgi:hypothetical protein
VTRPVAAAIAALGLFFIAVGAFADSTTITYPPTDGGVATLPRTANRKALGILNTYDVAICVAPASSPAVCWPVAPGSPLYLDASDSHAFTVRLCSGASTVTCLPSGDAGVVTLEVH